VLTCRGLLCKSAHDKSPRIQTYPRGR